ncbi:cysteine desulfurase sufS family [Tupanvirus deep ocean]|uniref:Cysteine desulfurase sufS family n=2 Tax=Tupanvirus TaxID=2094720 RepID=A0AC62A9Q8_9VIRU|nr:cysteine desulfurase sufS family [Tupanvirus deep ocean]QKU34499.1 cysteine desulfurase sufS family [Tupanvirus deep ocean]
MSYLNQFKKGYFVNLENKKTESIFPKSDFPIFLENSNLIWFDNGATTQKPSATINCIREYYEKFNSNIHRSPHHLSMVSSIMFDETREITASYLGCQAKEIVFVKGTTEGINFLANSLNFEKLLGKNISTNLPNNITCPNDKNQNQLNQLITYSGIISKPHTLPSTTILLTNMEHHSNIVPWQMLYQKGLANIEYLIYDKDNNKLNLNQLEAMLSRNPSIKVVSVTHVSNVLGITNPIRDMADIVHKYGAILIVDGAQGIPHHKVNVRELDCDAYVFSSHKLFGPTGVGVVYCKETIYQFLEPWQGGGSMIKDVTLYTNTYQEPPHKFEAGTPNIADIIAFGSTLKYLEKIDWSKVEAYENELTTYMYQSLKKIPNITILGDTTNNKVPIYSFVIPDIDNKELLTKLDNHGIAIRYGHHCSMPIIRHYGYENVYRASLAPYNTFQEIDYFVSTILNFVSTNKK